MTSYIVTNEGRLRQTNDPTNTTAAEFPIAPHATTRTVEEGINVWLLLINADSKFQFFDQMYGIHLLPEDIQEVIRLTMDIVELMYREPIARTDAATQALAYRQRWRQRGQPRPDYREDEGGNESGRESAASGHSGNIPGGVGLEMTSE